MSTKPRKASIGSISERTLLNEHLLPAFAAELKWLGNLTETESKLLAEAEAWDPDETELGMEIVQDLMDALNERAPTCCYFGASEGDGASFGFWPCMDAVNELPRVSDPNEVENHRGEKCVFVNDHGNVTVYNADGSVAWDCV